jgi:hypothetical protein
LAVATLPAEMPSFLAADKGHLRERLLGVPAAALERRAHGEKRDGLFVEALALAPLVARCNGGRRCTQKCFSRMSVCSAISGSVKAWRV